MNNIEKAFIKRNELKRVISKNIKSVMIESLEYALREMEEYIQEYELNEPILVEKLKLKYDIEGDEL
jgi:hypothetical protein